MTPLVLALSISDKIEQVGSYAGYASVLGLGVLSMLYFAQAREVRRLREWAGRAPERAAELEAQAVQAAERVRATPAQPAATPVTAAATRAPAAAAQPTVASVPAGAPAGAVAATATAAAAAGATAVPAATPKPAVQGVPATAPGTPPGQPAAVPASSSVPPVDPPASAEAPSAPAPNGPATPAAAPTTADASPARPSAPEPVLPSSSILASAAAPPAPPRPSASEPSTAAGGARPRRSVELRSNAAQSATVEGGRPRDPGDDKRSPLRLLLPIGGALAVIVVLVVALTGGGEATKTPPNRVITTSTTTTGSGTTPTQAQTIIAVLNGTTVTGLAGALRDQLVAKGYQVDKVGDATDQSQPTSQVAFADGYESAARKVARIVGISTSEVVAMDPNTRVEAGDEARVVIVVGSDTATKAQ